MKTRYIFLLTAIALLASCAKEEKAPVASEKNFTVLQVGIKSETPAPAVASKTYMGEKNTQNHRKVYWSNGDKISVNGVASAALSGLDPDAATAKFTFEGVLNTPYKVLYPASIRHGEYYVDLPAVQEYKEGNFADGMFPMAGYSTDGQNIVMHHLCALVKISILQKEGGDTDDIVSVRFRGHNSEQISGTFEISYDGHSLGAATTSTEADLQVKVVKRQATSTSTPVDYYIVVPARAYQNGFDVIVQDAAGHIMTQTKTGYQFPEAGHILAMAAFEFVPTTTELGIEINSAADLVQFAQDYNAGNYGQDDLLVTLMQDISFDATSSAAFNATNGIGRKKLTNETDDHYFNGSFIGNNKVISGLEATVPLFAYTQSGTLIKDLTLDNTCSYTVNSPDTLNAHGALVGRNKGIVKNCTVAGNMTINNIQDVNTVAQHYGGLVGRNYGGTIDGCTVSGNIVCSQTGQTITAGTDLCAYVGGIAGTLANEGSVNDCSFTGSINIHDGTTYGGITAPGTYFYVAGVIGYAENGVISGCTNGVDGGSSIIDVRGSLVPAIGGILGWAKSKVNSEIRDCNNYARLSVASNAARADATPLRVGGIASRSAADIKDCNNSGAITTVSNSTTVYLGGIVADGANVSGCTNKAGGTLTRSNAEAVATQTNRYIYMGGIMGGTNTAGDVTGCKNYAAVTSNAIGTATQTTADMGGIVGCGGASTALQIDISSCENNGAVTLTNNGDVITTRLAIGGIIGYVPAANSTIKSCDNKAQVYCNSQTQMNGRVSYSGGIAGLMGTIAAGVAGLEIDNCTNSARVWNRNYNNTANNVAQTPFGGGIVGAIVGTTASKASIHDCSTSGNDVVELRGYSGGVAGYTNYATIEDNTVAQALTGSNKNAQGAGGLVGWVVNTSISGCSTSASINQVKNIGGLVAKLDAGSSITGCDVNGATLTTGTNAATAAAVLVSEAASGTTITNCGVKGTINGAAIDLSSNMITTDGGATVSGTHVIQ